MSQAEVKACIAEHGKLSCREVADLLKCSHGTTHDYIRKLRKKGELRIAEKRPNGRASPTWVYEVV